MNDIKPSRKITAPTNKLGFRLYLSALLCIGFLAPYWGPKLFPTVLSIYLFESATLLFAIIILYLLSTKQ